MPADTAGKKKPKSQTQHPGRAAIPMRPAEPEWDSTVLVAVTGMSPAVLTETVWQLAVEEDIIPDRVVAITTSKGREAIEEKLFKSGVWNQLRAALEKRGLDIAGRLVFGDDPESVRVCMKTEGSERVPVKDLATEADNAGVADSFVRVLRAETDSDHQRVIVSLAGGYKTMSALMLSCMTLFGRHFDRMNHVLVNAPYESAKPGFYFPDQEEQQLQCRARDTDNHVSLLAKDAKLLLVPVPLVTFRDLLKREVRREITSYSALVYRCQQAADDAALSGEIKVQLRVSEPVMLVSGMRIELSVAEYTLMLQLLQAAKKRERAIGSYLSAAFAVRETAKELYVQHQKNNYADWTREATPPEGFDAITDVWLDKKRSSLRAKLIKAGSPADLLLKLLPVKKRWSVKLRPQAITIGD